MAGDRVDDDQEYRALLDTLVEACRSGQGQIGPSRVRAGVWNANTTAEEDPEQHYVNLLLERTSKVDREILAGLLQQAFEAGVHETLAALHEAQMVPFDRAYEGTPFHDFVGRLHGWQWPTSSRRS
jgi:hypothetical protein